MGPCVLFGEMALFQHGSQPASIPPQTGPKNKGFSPGEGCKVRLFLDLQKYRLPLTVMGSCVYLLPGTGRCSIQSCELAETPPEVGEGVSAARQPVCSQQEGEKVHRGPHRLPLVRKLSDRGVPAVGLW